MHLKFLWKKEFLEIENMWMKINKEELQLKMKELLAKANKWMKSSKWKASTIITKRKISLIKIIVTVMSQQLKFKAKQVNLKDQEMRARKELLQWGNKILSMIQMMSQKLITKKKVMTTWMMILNTEWFIYNFYNQDII